MKVAPVQRYENTRVGGICHRRICYMMFKQYCIGELIEETNDAEEFDWVIKMYWDTWEKYCREDPQGINTDLRLDEYVRRFVPGFVRHRTMADAREDKPDYVKRCGMPYYNHFDFMTYSRGDAAIDPFYIGMETDDVYLPYCDADWIENNPEKVKHILRDYTRIFEKEKFHKLYKDIIVSNSDILERILDSNWNAAEVFYDTHPEKFQRISIFGTIKTDD
jgi:hypothetical protein